MKNSGFLQGKYRENGAKMNYEVGKGKPPKHTQFRKGKSGNPDGARKHDPVLRVIRGLTYLQLGTIVDCLFGATESEIRAITEDNSYPIFVQIIAKAILKSLDENNMDVVEKLMDRMLGKPAARY